MPEKKVENVFGIIKSTKNLFKQKYILKNWKKIEKKKYRKNYIDKIK